MTADGVSIDVAGPPDLEEVGRLVNTVQPHVPWDAARLRWGLLDPPAGPARTYVARLGGRVVSLYVVVPLLGRIGGADRRLWRVQDVMTHPDVRGRGLLHTLGERALADIHATEDGAFTFPNARSQRSFGRLGWTDRGPMPELLGEPDPTLPQAPATLLTPVPGPAALGDLPERVWRSSDLGDGVHRTAIYLGWRYGGPSSTSYRFDVVGDEEGFLVTKLYASGDTRRLHVCELVVPAERDDLVRAVLRRLHRRCIDVGAHDLHAWCPDGHPHRAAHLASGLVPHEDPERRVYVAGAGPGPRWHLSAGDSDVY